MYARAVPPSTVTPTRRASWRPARRPTSRLIVCVTAVLALVAGCGTISSSGPAPTPADFPALAGILARSGITVSRIVSGDAGCADTNLAKTAIAFDAAGADQTTPIRMRIFIFRNRDAYTRQRAAVDQCAAAFVTDPATFESLDASPFVVAGQGPWGTTFKDRLRAALVEAAGTGG